MPVRPGPAAGRLLSGLLAGRLVAGPGIEDAVRVAAELVADGRLVALEHTPAPGDDADAERLALIGAVHAAGLAAACELTIPPGPGAGALVEAAEVAGIGVAAGEELGLPRATVVVRAGAPDAESRCRSSAGKRVRLVQGRGAREGLAFVRCLTVLMAGAGRPAIAATDPRLLAIAGERAAWNGRTPDSWEYVMPMGILRDQQHRLVAGGSPVRVVVPSGAGAAAALARRFGGRP